VVIGSQILLSGGNGERQMEETTKNIPVLCASGKSLPEAWEKSVLELWEKGVPIHTEYDKQGDPPSRDATMLIVVEDPFAEPRIHLAFPGGIEDLEKYRLEVIEGVHDHWICPEQGKWTYTYHKRLFDYRVVDSLEATPDRSLYAPVNQVRLMVEKLSQVPHTRRAQAITWMPTLDPTTDDPPCLQRIWCRLLGDAEGGWLLNMNTHWRSRDAFKAAFMNIYAFTDLQRRIAEEIGHLTGQRIGVGRYVDMTDSYHIYGSYFGEFNERFLRNLRERTFAQRTWRSDDPRVLASIEWGKREIEEEQKQGGT
jgi:thymidylate synthase